MKKYIGLGIAIIIIILLMIGYSYSPLPFTKKERVTDIHIDKNPDKPLHANLNINYGNVYISSGGKELVNGDITYNVRKLKPKVKYKNKGKTSTLTINQPGKGNVSLTKGSLKNDWDLQFTNDTPIDLNVSTGAAKTYMDLQGMRLRSLNIESGVGSTTIDLSGNWLESFDLDMEMGVGETTVILPQEVGVKLKAEKGIGAINVDGLISEGDGMYANKAYNNTETTINIHAELGIGEANFILAE